MGTNTSHSHCMYTVSSLKPSHSHTANLYDCFTIINSYTVERLRPSHSPNANLFNSSSVIYPADNRLNIFTTFHSFYHVFSFQFFFILSGIFLPLIYSHTKMFSFVF